MRRYGTYLATALLAGALGWLAGLGMRGGDAPASPVKEAGAAMRPPPVSAADAGEPGKRRTKAANRVDKPGDDDEEAAGIGRVLYHPDGSATFPGDWARRLSIHPFSPWDLKLRREDLALLGVSDAETEALQAMVDDLTKERFALERQACKVLERKDGSILMKVDAIKVAEGPKARMNREMRAILQERAELVEPLLSRYFDPLVSDSDPRVIYREAVEGDYAKYWDITYDEEAAARYDRELTIEEYKGIGIAQSISQTRGTHPRLGHLFPEGE